MGVPSFFRWLIKRYPHVVADCVEEERLDSAAQFGPNPNGTEFDALYLDMNGIIHRASHPEDQPAPESEEAMMQAMFAFIDRLMNIVRPQKLLYIGIDGVAPRAKMNQQRSRRFLAAKHRLEEEAKAAESADAADSDGARTEPAKPIFDHNVITPGTEFMSRVAEALRGHFAQKINTDPNWSRLAVILSDACVPGEGEHKIMEFIRTQRIQEGYNANAPIAVYGLDADLIFLTLAQHEPRFSILREEVSSVTCFVCHKTGHISSDCPQLHPEEHEGEDEDKQGPPELKFQWLHSGVLREYLDREFRHLPLAFPYSLERIIDDWIVICFLAGNDFLPRLPSVAIHEGAIDTLTSAYKQLLPTLDGYICSNGNIDFRRLAPVVAVVAESEEEVLIDRKKNFLRKQRQERAFQRELREGRGNEDDDDDDDDGEGRRHHGKAKEAGGGHHKKPVHYRRREGRRSREDEAGEIEATYSDDEDDDEDSIRIGESGWRDRYLLQKFGVPAANREFYQGVVRAYVEGLQWVARYYWQGCVSWKWFYAYHYPPMATMLADGIGKFRTADVLSSFQLSRPFHPFAQLMAVLPAASAHALPAPCRALMTSADSPIADFYPTNIEIDMDGVSHNMEWAGVVKLPFVDEARLLAVLEPLERQLTPDEVHRNSFGLPRLLLGPASPVHAAAKAKLAGAEARLTMAHGDGFLAGSLKAVASNAEATGDVVACDYSLPPRPAGEFVSGLLPTVILPEPRLAVLEEDEGDEDDGQEGYHRHDGGHREGDERDRTYYRGRGRGRAGRGRGRQHQDDPTEHHQKKERQHDEAHGGGHHQAAAHRHHETGRGGHHHASAHNQRGDW